MNDIESVKQVKQIDKLAQGFYYIGLTSLGITLVEVSRSKEGIFLLLLMGLLSVLLMRMGLTTQHKKRALISVLIARSTDVPQNELRRGFIQLGSFSFASTIGRAANLTRWRFSAFYPEAIYQYSPAERAD